MRQPAKSVKLAPAARCTSSSGLTRPLVGGSVELFGSTGLFGSMSSPDIAGDITPGRACRRGSHGSTAAWELTLCHEPERFTCGSALSPWAGCSGRYGSGTSTVQRGLVSTVRIPESLAGRLAPSVAVQPTLPRCVVGPNMWLYIPCYQFTRCMTVHVRIEARPSFSRLYAPVRRGSRVSRNLITTRAAEPTVMRVPQPRGLMNICVLRSGPVVCSPPAPVRDTTELLHIHMHQPTGAVSFVTDRGLLRSPQ